MLGGPGHPQDSDRVPSDHIGDSDNSNYFSHHSDIKNGRNINLLEGDLERVS